MSAFGDPIAAPVGPGRFRRLRWMFRTVRRPSRMEFPRHAILGVPTCAICDYPEPRWEIERWTTDDRRSWACERHLSKALDRWQKPGEVTLLVVTDRRSLVLHECIQAANRIEFNAPNQVRPLPHPCIDGPGIESCGHPDCTGTRDRCRYEWDRIPLDFDDGHLQDGYDPVYDVRLRERDPGLPCASRNAAGSAAFCPRGFEERD